MDMNVCQSLETLCLNFWKSVEFESEGERERSGGKKEKITDKISPSCLQTWETPLSAVCCLGVMQISPGCLSRLNRRWPNRYKAGRRSAATEKTGNTETMHKIYTLKDLHSHTDQDKKRRHSAIIYKHYSQASAIIHKCCIQPSLRPVKGRTLQLLVNA